MSNRTVDPTARNQTNAFGPTVGGGWKEEQRYQKLVEQVEDTVERAQHWMSSRAFEQDSE